MSQSLPWTLIAILASTGLVMGLMSCLVGMRQKLEIPLWWSFYALWIAVVLVTNVATPFRTLFIASVLAGVIHGVTQAALLRHYVANNPWYADQMRGPPGAMRRRFLVTGLVIGALFGAIVGGIAWAIRVV